MKVSDLLLSRPIAIAPPIARTFSTPVPCATRGGVPRRCRHPTLSPPALSAAVRLRPVLDRGSSWDSLRRGFQGLLLLVLLRRVVSVPDLQVGLLGRVLPDAAPPQLLLRSACSAPISGCQRDRSCRSGWTLSSLTGVSRGRIPSLHKTRCLARAACRRSPLGVQAGRGLGGPAAVVDAEPHLHGGRQAQALHVVAGFGSGAVRLGPRAGHGGAVPAPLRAGHGGGGRGRGGAVGRRHICGGPQPLKHGLHVRPVVPALLQAVLDDRLHLGRALVGHPGEHTTADSHRQATQVSCCPLNEVAFVQA